MAEAYCDIHGLTNFLYSKPAQAKLCIDCVKEGKYSAAATLYITEMYPKYFPDAQDWIVTLPRKYQWKDYVKELEAVQDGKFVLNYKLPFGPIRPKVKVGDRCFITHFDHVMGWIRIVGMDVKSKPWQCETTGTYWPPGLYVKRTGVFHHMDGTTIVKGFRGIRRYDGNSQRETG